MKNSTLQTLLKDLPPDAELRFQLASVPGQNLSLVNVYSENEKAENKPAEVKIIVLLDY